MATTSLLRRNFNVPQQCVPLGVEAIYSRLVEIYPAQSNPVQVSTQKKYWLGGSDPLDYVNIYYNSGDREMRIPPHWHYVSMGLTDLHGDNRVHKLKAHHQPSAFGFELTFRLKKENDENKPPLWPAAMMQHLAKYVYRSAKLAVGDFVKWNASLDGFSESRIRHILIVNDPQLATVYSPYGFLDFLQIVGVCEDEMQAVRKWNGRGVADLLRKNFVTGGCWLITDLRRDISVFDSDPDAVEIVKLGVGTEGSNLGGVEAWCWWTEWNPVDTNSPNQHPKMSNEMSTFSQQQPSSRPAGRDPKNELSFGDLGNVLDTNNAYPLNGAEIQLNAEAAMFLPSALKGRLEHGRHFTFKGIDGTADVTFLPPGVTGTFASVDDPYAYRGTWLQVLVCPQLQELMLEDLTVFEFLNDTLQAQKTFQWPEYKLKITVFPDVCPT